MIFYEIFDGQANSVDPDQTALVYIISSLDLNSWL